MGRFIKRTRLGDGTLTTKSRRNTDVKIRGAWFGTWEQRRYRHDPAGSRREEICMTYDMIIRQRQCEPEEGYDETTSYDFEKSHMSVVYSQEVDFPEYAITTSSSTSPRWILTVFLPPASSRGQLSAITQTRKTKMELEEKKAANQVPRALRTAVRLEKSEEIVVLFHPLSLRRTKIGRAHV